MSEVNATFSPPVKALQCYHCRCIALDSSYKRWTLTNIDEEGNQIGEKVSGKQCPHCKTISLTSDHQRWSVVSIDYEEKKAHGKETN